MSHLWIGFTEFQILQIATFTCSTSLSTLQNGDTPNGDSLIWSYNALVKFELLFLCWSILWWIVASMYNLLILEIMAIMQPDVMTCLGYFIHWAQEIGGSIFLIDHRNKWHMSFCECAKPRCSTQYSPWSCIEVNLLSQLIKTNDRTAETWPWNY